MLTHFSFNFDFESGRDWAGPKNAYLAVFSSSKTLAGFQVAPMDNGGSKEEKGALFAMDAKPN